MINQSNFDWREFCWWIDGHSGLMSKITKNMTYKQRDQWRTRVRHAKSEEDLLNLEGFTPTILKSLKKEYIQSKFIGDISQEFKEILESPDLLEVIISQIQIKVVGEENSIRAIFINSCGRLVRNNNVASYNLIVNSTSGSGKDYVVSATLELWDKSICISRTRISPTVFTYWHTAKLEPGWTWDGKILVLQDISELVLNSETFKVMQSEGSTATITVNNRAEDIEVRGKPVMIITTAKSSPNVELIRRNLLCQLDESKEQTKQILKQQAEKAAMGKVDNPNSKLVKALTYLNRVSVKVNFANLFVERFPIYSVIMRTAFGRFIDIIRASASLHQYQREIDEEGYVLANGQDYDIAVAILKHLTKNGNMIPITRDQEEILSKFNGKEWCSVEAICTQLPISDKWLRTQLDRMVELGLLEISGLKVDISDKKVKHYRKLTFDTIDLPNYEELCRNRSVASIFTEPTIDSNTSNGKATEAIVQESLTINIERVLESDIEPEEIYIE